LGCWQAKGLKNRERINTETKKPKPILTQRLKLPNLNQNPKTSSTSLVLQNKTTATAFMLLTPS
jgi:hypothetical protein